MKHSGRFVSLSVVFSFLIGGCVSHLERPTFGPCADPDPVRWARQASAALQSLPFLARPLYDVALDGSAVSFRSRPLPADSRAVISYPSPERYPGGPSGFSRLGNRSFVYDNALYVLLRTWEGQEVEARQILQTLDSLQRADGAWGFSFNIQGDGFYNVGYVRTGTVAWVLYAMARYTSRFGDPRFLSTMRRAGAWVIAQLDPVSGLLRGGRGRWRADGEVFDPSYRVNWASTEHNVDAYFALRALEGVDPSGHWSKRISIERLAKRIQARLYIPSEGRYAQGLRLQGSPDRALDRESALDASGTWSALFELDRGRAEVVDGLIEWVDRHHGVEIDGWRGYRPYARGPRHANKQGPQVWFVEASVARALVLSRRGRHQEARAMIRELSSLACAAGVPLVYANRWEIDFPFTPALAPTVWYVLAVEEVWRRYAPFLWPRTPLTSTKVLN